MGRCPKPVYDVIRAHDEKIMKEYEEREKVELATNEFRMSWAGYCPRYIYYAKKYDDPAPVYLLKIYRIGDFVHRDWQDTILKVHGGEMEKEVTLDLGRIKLRGHIDVVDGRNRVWELKSAADLPKKPYREHVMQANLYMHAVGAEEGFIVYIKKNNETVKPFAVKHDGKAVNDAVEIFEYVLDCIEQDRLPLAVESWKCDNCRFKKRCERGEK